MMVLDPMYFLFILPAMALAGWASFKVKKELAAAAQIAPSSRLSGAEAADRILRANGLDDVRIESASGLLGDHYDPRGKVLRLTPPIYSGRTMAAVGVAAHEAGHALQDAHHYSPLKLRTGLVPMATFGSNFSFIIIFVGWFFLHSQVLLLAGIGLFSLTVLFQLVNLPVEFNASSRAREVLVDCGVVSRSELAPVSKVLNAAAMTYVAATLMSVLTLLYYLYRSGLLGGRR